MKRARKYSNEPLGRISIVEDFLPPPDQLVLKEDGVKATLSLSRRKRETSPLKRKKGNVPFKLSR
jgi:hypothetical protein